MKDFGFTIIELLIVIAIIAILIVISAFAFPFFQKESDLVNSTEEIINTLRLAQNKTLASEAASKYGVHFENSKIVLFKGASYNPLAPDNETHNLSSKVEIYEVDLTGGGSEVIFERIVGATNQPGKISLRLKDDLTKTKTITIQSSGRIILGEELAPSDSNRVKDSRHTHFTYGTNAQGAVTLHLIFPDYPGDNHNINFQNYLDAGKTEFFWEGTIPVGPVGNKTGQKLKIHTHSLSAFSAQFCVHRDRRFNDKALQITLDDQNLINYTADGTSAKGSSVYVSEPELQ